MKREYLWLFLLLLIPLGARAGTVVVRKTESPRMNVEVTTWIQGDQVRMDVVLSSGMSNVMIMDLAKNEFCTLMPKQKEAIKFGEAQIKSIQAKAEAELGGASKPGRPRDTGRTAMVNGYHTRIYDWTNMYGAHVELWVATNYPHGKQISAQLEKVDVLTSPDITRGLTRFDPAALPGLVLKETDWLHSTNQATTTLFSAKEETLPASLFVVPKDYHITDIQKQEEAAAKMESALKVGQAFPPFNVKSVSGEELSLTNYRGKVVMIDFWATWCPPCREEVPNVVATYKKYHSKGFDIIGISLDQNREKLLQFTKQQGMVWPQYFDGKGWSNKLAEKYGIQAIPATFLLDTHGKIIAKDLRGDALTDAVAKAVSR